MSRILILTMLGLCASLMGIAQAQKTPGKYASTVPKFTFSTDLEEQEIELANNPLLNQSQGNGAKLLALDAWQMKSIYDEN